MTDYEKKNLFANKVMSLKRVEHSLSLKQMSLELSRASRKKAGSKKGGPHIYSHHIPTFLNRHSKSGQAHRATLK